jgi:hypothetical protein
MMLYGLGMTLDEAQEHFSDMLDKLADMKASPWPYLCAAAMLEYLAKMSIDRTPPTSKQPLRDAPVYIKFIKDYMPPPYRDYRFGCGKRDLPYQMYHVLRCGIIHSFSLVPDRRYHSAADGRKGSIVISHTGAGPHLTPFQSTTNRDAVLFVFDQFCADIRSALEEVFKRAQSDSALLARITQFLQDTPPIQELSPGAAASGVHTL